MIFTVLAVHTFLLLSVSTLALLIGNALKQIIMMLLSPAVRVLNLAMILKIALYRYH